MTKEELKSEVYQALGTASMCWSETPTGIFDGNLAKQVGDTLWEKIEKMIDENAEKAWQYDDLCK